MPRPFKSVERYTYTEIVYHDSSGIEVARERQHDDAWYDTDSVEDMTDGEIEEYCYE